MRWNTCFRHANVTLWQFVCHMMTGKFHSSLAETTCNVNYFTRIRYRKWFKFPMPVSESFARTRKFDSWQNVTRLVCGWLVSGTRTARHSRILWHHIGVINDNKFMKVRLPSRANSEVAVPETGTAAAPRMNLFRRNSSKSCSRIWIPPDT